MINLWLLSSIFFPFLAILLKIYFLKQKHVLDIFLGFAHPPPPVNNLMVNPL